MSTRTLYVAEKDEAVWDEARRYLLFYRNQSVSQFVMEKLVEVLAEMKATEGEPGKGVTP